MNEQQKYIESVKGQMKKLLYLESMMEKLPEPSEISIKEGKLDRWTGFIQGALWAMNLGDIDVFRKDVREGKAVEALEEFFEKLNGPF